MARALALVSQQHRGPSFANFSKAGLPGGGPGDVEHLRQQLVELLRVHAVRFDAVLRGVVIAEQHSPRPQVPARERLVEPTDHAQAEQLFCGLHVEGHLQVAPLDPLLPGLAVFAL